MQLKKAKYFFNPGFTLLELLVVIAILGILSTIGIGSFLSSQVKSRDARRKGDLQSVAAALEMYYNDKGEYPKEDNFHIVGCDVQYCEWGTEWSQATPPVVYMAQLPIDPSGNYYSFHAAADGSWYILYARLENTKDKAVNQVGEGGGFEDTECSSQAPEFCNYAIKSANASLPDLE